jgi:hypothetical protein
VNLYLRRRWVRHVEEGKVCCTYSEGHPINPHNDGKSPTRPASSLVMSPTFTKSSVYSYQSDWFLAFIAEIGLLA